jgi:hypothetical protein
MILRVRFQGTFQIHSRPRPHAGNDDVVGKSPGDGLDFYAPDYNSPFFFLPFTSVTVAEDTIDAVATDSSAWGQVKALYP